MTKLIYKDTSFLQEGPQQQAFENLKEAFIIKLILVIYDPDKPLIIETDTLDKVLRAYLSQLYKDGNLYSIIFYSCKFSSVELNYKIYDKELLAIVDIFKQWKTYLEGVKYSILVLTDYKNLTSFINMKILNKRQIYWSEELSQYNFIIRY